MASVINTNTLSMVTQQNLNQSQNALNTSMERLSSGMRINSAKDDAAGQAIANRMDSQITGLSQAQRNANDGISVAQTTEGALNQVNDNLQRVRELTVQAQNGTNNADDLSSIQDEITMRLDEINRISSQTSFNGVDVLQEDNTLSIQVGANDGETITIDLKQINAETLGLANFSVQKQANITLSDPVDLSKEITTQIEDNDDIDASSLGLTEGTVSGVVEDTDNPGDYYVKIEGETTDPTKNGLYSATIDENTGEVSITGTTTSTVTNSNSITELKSEYTTHKVLDEEGSDTGLYAMKDADGNIYAADYDQATGNISVKTATYTDASGAAQTANIQLGGLDGVTEYISDNGKNYDATDIEGKDLQSDTVSEIATSTTADPLKALDAALKEVDSMRSDLGAVQNRFDSAITNLATTETNLASAQSRIQDADYAEEVSSMTTAQILQQAGTSMLTQANQVPQNVLSLLG